MSEHQFETAALRLAAIVEFSDDAIISKDRNGTIQSWNRGAERMFGYTAAEAIGRSIRLIIPDDLQHEEDLVLARILSGQSVDHFETIRRRKDGTFVPISLSVSPLLNADGHVIGASKIARDISERKLAEELLERLKSAQLDLQNRLIALVAASGTLLRSPSVEDVLTATVKLARQMVEADGYAVWRLDHDTWRIGSYEGISDRFAGGIISTFQREGGGAVPFTEPLVVEDVTQVPMLEIRRDAYKQEGIASMLAVPLTIHGQMSGTLVFYYRRRRHFSDVETQVALALGNLASAAITTAELYDAQRRMRGHSDFLAEVGGVLATSLDYQTTLKRVASLAVPHIADWCAVDLVTEGGDVEGLEVAHVDPARVEMTRRFQERYLEQPDLPYGVRHVIRTGQPEIIEELTDEMIVAGARDEDNLEAIRELGVTSIICVPLVARGHTLGAITFASAESRRRYSGEDLIVAQEIASRAAQAVDNSRYYEEARRASQLKDDFLATLSHELRTPLNAILGYARMLKSGMLEGARQTKGLEILERNATSLTQIVEDVLDVSRIISGKIRLNVQPVDLPAILTQGIATMQPAADAKGVRVEAVFDPRATPVAGDPDRLQQVVWNLVSNAVKFTPRGERIQIRLERADSHIDIVISDTGIGIAPEFLPHIFERFRQADSRFSREHGGLGLGLAISRHIVEMHGGTIVAASDGIGRGATFRIKLPMMIVDPDALHDRRPVDSAVDEMSDVRSRSLSGVRVLAVDDDDDALQLLRQILEAAGAEVTTRESGKDALETVHQIPPHVLICDIGMPEMDGFELISRLRQSPVAEAGNIPAAALTAYARSEDRTRALRAGFQMHLAKPIDPEELLAAVSALAGRKE